MLSRSYSQASKIPLNLSILSFMGGLKNSLKIFHKHANLKYKNVEIDIDLHPFFLDRYNCYFGE